MHVVQHEATHRTRQCPRRGQHPRGAAPVVGGRQSPGGPGPGAVEECAVEAAQGVLPRGRSAWDPGHVESRCRGLRRRSGPGALKGARQAQGEGVHRGTEEMSQEHERGISRSTIGVVQEHREEFTGAQAQAPVPACSPAHGPGAR